MGILIAFIVIAVVTLFLVLYGSFSWGFVLYKFWYWFILPVFPTLPEITFWHAMGLFLFIGFFRIGDGQVIKDKYKDGAGTIFGNLLSPWVLLLVGHIINSWFLT